MFLGTKKEGLNTELNEMSFSKRIFRKRKKKIVKLFFIAWKGLARY